MPTIKQAFAEANKELARNLSKDSDTRAGYRALTSLVTAIVWAFLGGFFGGIGWAFGLVITALIVWQPTYTILVKYMVLSYEESIDSEQAKTDRRY